VDLPLSLDPQQRKAVLHEGHLVLSACPGSGKTRVLSCKAARILSNEATRVVAVTFTRDAAEEMGRRILRLCPAPEVKKRLASGTFHSLALNQLKKAVKTIRIIGKAEQSNIIKSICNSPEIKIKWDKSKQEKQILEEIEDKIAQFKSTLYPVIDSTTPEGIAFRLYQNHLCKIGAFDFSDLISESVRMMISGEISPINATHMLVDESQDMDEIQLAWIGLHAESGTKVTIVGDDDQSIYGFRFALGFDGMERFRTKYDADHIVLAVNYRSRAEVIKVATEMICHNTQRIHKAIAPARGEGGKVCFFTAHSQKDEADRMAEFIAATGLPGDWVILARTNNYLRKAEAALGGLGIPHKTVNKKRFWEDQEPAVFLSILKSIISGDGIGDAIALGWAGLPHRVLDSIEPGNSWETWLGKVLAKAKKGGDRAAVKMLQTYLERRQGWAENQALNRTSLVVTGVAQWMLGILKSNDRNKSIIEDVVMCRETIQKLKGPLMGRISYLQSPPRQVEGIGQVLLMSIHNSKGLEFPNVWLLGATEGVLPLSRNMPADEKTDTKGKGGKSTAKKEGSNMVFMDIAEERRLAYVAMTRAQDLLCISSAIGETDVVSRFLYEARIPED
jgi:superfamily I DNA/RNA helicase